MAPQTLPTLTTTYFNIVSFPPSIPVAGAGKQPATTVTKRQLPATPVTTKRLLPAAPPTGRLPAATPPTTKKFSLSPTTPPAHYLYFHSAPGYRVKLFFPRRVLVNQNQHLVSGAATGEKAAKPQTLPKQFPKAHGYHGGISMS